MVRFVWLFRSIFICTLIVITCLALMEVPELPITLWDKFSHALAFATLLFLADRSFPEEGFPEKGALKTYSFVYSVKVLGLFTYGIMIEMAQSFLPYREASTLDLIANASGLLFYTGVRWSVKSK